MSAVHGMPETRPPHGSGGPATPGVPGAPGGAAGPGLPGGTEHGGGLAPLAPPASLGRRVAAYVIDAVIATLVASVAIIGAIMLWLSLLGALMSGASGANAASVSPGASLPALILVIAGALLSTAWSIVWVAMQGGRGSIGMRLMKIRLVRLELGTSLGFWRALGRAIVFSLLAGVVVGYVTPLFDRTGRRQGWHDLMVGAIMVDAPAFDEAVAQAAALAAAPPPAPAPVVIEEIDRDRPFGLPGARPTVPPVPGARGLGAGVAPAGAALPAAPLIGDVPAHLAPRTGAPEPARVPAGAPASAPTPAPAVAPDFAPAAQPPLAATQLELRWDDGTVVTIPHGAVIGRDPVASTDAVRVSSKLADARSIAVPDDSYSLSKTHFGAGIDADGAWIVDLHSTNGMILHRAGVAAYPLTPGALTAILAGDVVVIGDRRVTISLVLR